LDTSTRNISARLLPISALPPAWGLRSLVRWSFHYYWLILASGIILPHIISASVLFAIIAIFAEGLFKMTQLIWMISVQEIDHDTDARISGAYFIDIALM
jgi:hypothetical protein